jgi:hypothetical protein
MGRLALELEKILAACADKGVPLSVQHAITQLYKQAYREGYRDAETDCQEAQEENRELDLY